MASLKEIKGRIASVKSTQKITSAMKMVASAKLRKAQYKIDSFLPYQYKLNELLRSFLASIADFETNLAEEREVKRVALVVLSSNSSLCGAFNSNIIKLLKETIERYSRLDYKDIEIYPIGKKVEDHIRKTALPCPIVGSYVELMDKPHFDGAKQISDLLIQSFLQRRIDRVELLYNHSKTTTVQIPTAEQYLPISLQAGQSVVSTVPTDYIIEPDKETVLQSLLPKSLHSKIYAILLDSAAAEQGARVVAMQIATDNADDILDELTIQYNKQRQQAITSELLDIIGGSEALK
ncbi:MAG: F0F1 ATP synthase subunit gamma [Dysgonamonadaceae bacterium]|jgi:F-type H+-transporting ATPase subunit gamma|nr:F0F1 ATP synthase subunit gamma [Dysgonamonadaceae bacterium]